jgi:hypothetical protein
LQTFHWISGIFLIIMAWTRAWSRFSLLAGWL